MIWIKPLSATLSKNMNINSTQKTKILIGITFISIVSVTALTLSLFKKADAASITTVRTKSDSTYSTDFTAGDGSVDAYVGFQVPTGSDITTSSIIEITFDDDAGTGAGFGNAENITSSDVHVQDRNTTLGTATSDLAISSVSSSPGYVSITLGTIATIIADDWVSVQIGDSGGNQLVAPTAGNEDNYNFSVSINRGGSGTNYDTGAGLAYVSNYNDLTITATVPPVIDMEIFDTGGSPTLSCSLGVLSISRFQECVYDIGAATNISAGLTINVEVTSTPEANGALLHSDDSSDIDEVAVGGDVSAGSEEYGFAITEDASGAYDGGIYEEPIPSDTITAEAEPVPISDTTFASTSTVIDGINQQSERLEVRHYGAMATNTLVGVYDQVITYTAYTN